jgi:hypothetical protein
VVGVSAEVYADAEGDVRAGMLRCRPTKTTPRLFEIGSEA